MSSTSASPPSSRAARPPAAPELVERLPDGRLRCYACGHRCPIPEGREGVCRVRYNEGGVLRGAVGLRRRAPVRSDREEAVLPRPARAPTRFPSGCSAATCTARYCQNWFTSQSIRDPEAVASPRDVSPEELAPAGASRAARRPSFRRTTSRSSLPSGRSRSSRRRKRRGLYTAYVSNGNGTPQVLDYIRPWIDFYKVDLKSMDDKHYRQLGGVLQNVLDTIAGHPRARDLARGPDARHPGLQRLATRSCAARRGSSRPSRRDIPWHVTAFHPDYKMTDRGATPAETLVAGRGDRDGGRPALRLRGQPPRPGGRVGEHALPRVRRDRHRALRLPRREEPPRRRRLSPTARPRSPAAGTQRPKEPRAPTASPFPSSNALALRSRLPPASPDRPAPRHSTPRPRHRITGTRSLSPRSRSLASSDPS